MKGPKKLHFVLTLAISGLGLLAVGAIAVFSLVFSNIYTEIKLEKQKLSLEQEKEKQLKDQAGKLIDLQDKYGLISRTLPDNKDVSRLVSQLEGLMCGDNTRPSQGCIVKSLSFGSVSSIPAELKAVALKNPDLSQSYAKGDLALLAISLSIETSFSDFYYKLKTIENFSRYLHVSRINITPGGKISAILDMYTYYQPETITAPVEAAPPAEN